MMNAQDKHDAAALLAQAAESGPLIERLPEGLVPTSIADALEIQAQVVARSGKPVAGWKVATLDGIPAYGAIYAEDCYATPARVTLSRYPLAGMEGEIAFVFGQDLPPGAPLERAEIEKLLHPLPVIEIVDSRFADYAGTPLIARIADRMSSGAMVIGQKPSAFGTLADLRVRLTIDDAVAIDQRGGHPRRDPLLPVIEFINAVRASQDFRAGQFITAGSYTGLKFARAGENWAVAFDGMERVQVVFD